MIASPIPAEHRTTAARWLPIARRTLGRTDTDLATVHQFETARTAIGRASARALHPAGGGR